jgi:hypothetical protein
MVWSNHHWPTRLTHASPNISWSPSPESVKKRFENLSTLASEAMFYITPWAFLFACLVRGKPAPPLLSKKSKQEGKEPMAWAAQVQVHWGDTPVSSTPKSSLHLEDFIHCSAWETMQDKKEYLYWKSRSPGFSLLQGNKCSDCWGPSLHRRLTGNSRYAVCHLCTTYTFLNWELQSRLGRQVFRCRYRANRQGNLEIKMSILLLLVAKYTFGTL